MSSYKGGVLAEYVCLDAHQVPRSKTMTMTTRPTKVEDLRVWDYEDNSIEQAEGSNSECLLYPRAILNDPFRKGSLIICAGRLRQRLGQEAFNRQHPCDMRRVDDQI